MKITNVISGFHYFSSFCLDQIRVYSLAHLCQEYQVDWLCNKIEKHLSTAKLSNIDIILGYLKISFDMGFIAVK